MNTVNSWLAINFPRLKYINFEPPKNSVEISELSPTSD